MCTIGSCRTTSSTSCPSSRPGKNVIVAAHGNSLRALVKHLGEHRRRRRSQAWRSATGEMYLYDVEPSGKIASKEIRAAHPNLV